MDNRIAEVLRACNVFFMSANNGVATVSVGVGIKERGKVSVKSCATEVIASSLKTSVEKMTPVGSFSFEFTDEKTERGVIITKITDTDGEAHIVHICVDKESDGKIKINEYRSFVPDSGRLGQVYDNGTINVTIDDVVYTNSIPNDLSKPHPEYRLIDGNDLCRYMVGIIDKDQLEKASTEHVAALTQAEYIIELQNKLTDMHVENGELRTKIADLMVEKQNLNEKIYEQKDGEAILVAILDELVWRLRDAAIGKNRKFFLRTLRNSIKEFIKNYNITCWRFPNKELRSDNHCI